MALISSIPVANFIFPSPEGGPAGVRNNAFTGAAMLLCIYIWLNIANQISFSNVIDLNVIILLAKKLLLPQNEAHYRITNSSSIVHYGKTT